MFFLGLSSFSTLEALECLLAVEEEVQHISEPPKINMITLAYGVGMLFSLMKFHLVLNRLFNLLNKIMIRLGQNCIKRIIKGNY